MPPADDYAGGAGGKGKLKLKGAKIKDGRVDKKKKKKKQQKDKPSKEPDASVEKTGDPRGSEDRETGDDEGGSGTEPAQIIGKTEAERRYEEIRKKRLDDRLKREGIKTHKERVEELNKYLSNLSEHHDMPRIGPG